MNCTDCKAEDADCLTADRVRVCSDCLYERVVKQRDEARNEVERLVIRIAVLETALASISLDEYESTSSASEKVHGHARIARRALYGEK